MSDMSWFPAAMLSVLGEQGGEDDDLDEGQPGEDGQQQWQEKSIEDMSFAELAKVSCWLRELGHGVGAALCTLLGR
jgi:hypothetical protein